MLDCIDEMSARTNAQLEILPAPKQGRSRIAAGTVVNRRLRVSVPRRWAAHTLEDGISMSDRRRQLARKPTLRPYVDNPIRGSMHLPQDCADAAGIDWSPLPDTTDTQDTPKPSGEQPPQARQRTRTSKQAYHRTSTLQRPAINSTYQHGGRS